MTNGIQLLRDGYAVVLEQCVVAWGGHSVMEGGHEGLVRAALAPNRGFRCVGVRLLNGGSSGPSDPVHLVVETCRKRNADLASPERGIQ